MRVFYDPQIFMLQKYGGISRYFMRLAENLDHQSHKVLIPASGYKNYYLSETEGSFGQGRKAVHAQRRKRRLAQRIRPHVLNLRAAIFRPDIVHETYYNSPNRLSAAACPRVVTVYDMIHEKFPEMFWAGDRTTEHKRNSVQHSDLVICISENTRRDLCDAFDLDSSKTAVVHLAVDSVDATNEINSNVDLTHDRPYILYVGDRRGYKNFSRLLDAFTQSAKLRSDFRVLAFGGGAVSKEEEDKIRSLGLQPDEVDFIAGDDRSLSEAYRRAAVFIYPSLYEGFGLPPLEAMARGCPVVASDTSSLPEVVGNAAELVNPHSSASIRVGLENVLYSGSTRHELITAGFDRVKKFSWARCARETSALYCALAR